MTNLFKRKYFIQQRTQACIQLYSDPSYFYQQWLNDMVAMVSVAHELDAFEITMTIERLFFVFLFS